MNITIIIQLLMIIVMCNANGNWANNHPVMYMTILVIGIVMMIIIPVNGEKKGK